MNRASDELLADAAFAANQHGDVAVGDAIDDGRDRSHRVAVGPERERLIVIELPAQLADFGDELPLLDRLLDRRLEGDFAEAVGIVGLDDVVDGAEIQRFDNRLRVLAARQHDDLEVLVRGFQTAKRRDAVHAGHHDVEQDHVGQLAEPRRGEKVLAMAVDPRHVPARFQKRLQVVRKRGVVVCDGNLRRSHDNRILLGTEPDGRAVSRLRATVYADGPWRINFRKDFPQSPQFPLALSLRQARP